MTQHNDSVQAFFERLSDQYDSKYSPSKNKFLSHFFRRRLEQAVADLPQSLGTVMDIGAGTGQLYRFLIDQEFGFKQYIGVDLSEGMLAKSPIPENNRHVGTVLIPTLDGYRGAVDHFFLLGVTTYMTSEELKDTLERINQLSASNGVLICTFTNRNSFEFLVQATISSLLRVCHRVIGKELQVVAAQKFPRLVLSEAAMKSALEPHGAIEKVDYINQTLTPLNRLLPGASIRLEAFLARLLRNRPAFLAPLSSDILFRIRLRSGGAAIETPSLKEIRPN